MSLDKKELVGKLEEISDLYENIVSIRDEMETFEPDDCYEREVQVPEFPGDFSEDDQEYWIEQYDHEDEEAEDRISAAYQSLFPLKRPTKPRIESFTEPPMDGNDGNKGCIGWIFGIVGALFGASLFTSWPPATFNVVVTFIGLGVFAFCTIANQSAKGKHKKKVQQARAEHERKESEILADYDAKVKDYEEKVAANEAKLQVFLEEYRQWRKVYLNSLQEEREIAEQLEADRQEAVDSIYEDRFVPAKEKLIAANDLVPEAYLSALPIIIDLIRSNRADDLKEAINLYEALVYRERQLAQERERLEFEREKEYQRMYEAQQEREEQQRQYDDQMAFLKEQERQRKYEAEKQMQMQEQHHREAMKKQDALLRQERVRAAQEQAEASKRAREQRDEEQRLSNAASAQCRACVHSASCNMKTYNKTPNCTGFRPR